MPTGTQKRFALNAKWAAANEDDDDEMQSNTQKKIIHIGQNQTNFYVIKKEKKKT